MTGGILLLIVGLALLSVYLIAPKGALGQLLGNLSPSQISQVASNAGFSGADLVTAVAIALAESSGDPKAEGDQTITPGGSVGLWQINLKYHPEFAGQDLTDPQTNANAAFSVYQAAGRSFQPWSTFKTGAYSAYLSQAEDGTGVA